MDVCSSDLAADLADTGSADMAEIGWVGLARIVWTGTTDTGLAGLQVPG